MRQMVALAAIACSLVPRAGLAQDNPANDKVTFGPVPDWATVPDPLPVPDDQRGIAFIRQGDSEIHLDQAGQTAFQSFRIRLLQSNALQLGNISIAWNPAAGAPVVHALKVYRDGEVRNVLDETSFEVLRREDNLEQAMLSGVLTAVLRVPDLRVGDELEFAYSLRQQDPTLGPDSSGALLLAPSPAPGRFRIRLSWDKGQEPVLKMTPDLAGMTTRTANSFAINTDMPGPSVAPKDAPPRFAWQRIAEFSDFPDWQAVSGRLAPLFDATRKLAPDSPLKAEAARIAAAHKDPLERAAAVLDLVQQQVRYIYVGLNEGNLTPASADTTWQRRYGDCKGKTALVLALLDELGIDAQPVLADNAGNDDGLDERLPNPGMFDHVLVRAKVAGKAYWLDATLPEVVPPTAAPSLPYRWVLPLADGGQALERVPWHSPDRPDTLVLFEIDARAGFDQPAKKKMTTITRGVDALTEYVRYSAVTDDQITQAYRQNAEGGSTWDTIDNVDWKFDRASQASVLTIQGTGPLDWDDTTYGGRDLTLPGGGFNPPDRRQRSSAQDQDAPFYSAPEFDCRVTTVRLPADTDPAKWSYNSTFDVDLYGRVYRRAFERRDGQITMLRESRVMKTEISAQDAAKDNARLADFDNSMARIVYYSDDPVALRTNQSVPTTFDVDWLSNDAACRRPQKAGG